MRCRVALFVALCALGCGAEPETAPPLPQLLHEGQFMTGSCTTRGSTLPVGVYDTSPSLPAWAVVTALPHTRSTEPAWRVTTPCLDGTTGFEVTALGRVVEYRGTLTRDGRRYTVRSIADDAGVSGYLSDSYNGDLSGSIPVEVSDGATTTRAVLDFLARR